MIAMAKQFMVLEFADKLGSALSLIPHVSLLSRHAAEEFIERLKEINPEHVYVIQEVGAA